MMHGARGVAEMGRKNTNCEATADFDETPDELKARPQWVGYILVAKKKTDPEKPWKQDKPPIDAKTGKPASVSDPASWCAYHAAVEAYEAGRGDGIGFGFTAEDPFAGIDLDDCRDPETGIIEDWARAIMDRFPGWYWEASPSGHGVKGIGRGTLPPGGRKCGDIEVYDRGRFFTVTGEYVAGTTLVLEDHTAELAVWHAHVFGQKAEPRKKTHAMAKNSQQDMGRVQEALSHIPADDYDVWLRVGMALHSTGRAEAFTLWCDWSRTCPEKFDPEACHKKWASFSAERDTAVTIATIFQIAKELGWRSSRNGARTAEAPPEPVWSATADGYTTTPQPEPSPERRSFNLTDLGNAERLMHVSGDRLRYCDPWKKWLVWDTVRWKMDISPQPPRHVLAVLYG